MVIKFFFYWINYFKLYNLSVCNRYTLRWHNFAWRCCCVSFGLKKKFVSNLLPSVVIVTPKTLISVPEQSIVNLIVGCILFIQLTLFRMGIFEAAHGWRKGWICHTFPTMIKLGSYTLPQEDPKNIWITWHTPRLPLTSAFFHRKSGNFVTSRKVMTS